MACSPITSCQIDGGKVEAVTGFLSLGSKITVDSDCSHEIKRCLLRGRKAMTNLESILKSRKNYFADKGSSSQSYSFSSSQGWMWQLDQKAEHWRIDAFELWCWRKLLRVPWTAKRFKQSILKEISPKYSLEGLMLKLKLWYIGHLMRRTHHWKSLWCWERLKAGEGHNRGWDGWMASTTWWT